MGQKSARTRAPGGRCRQDFREVPGGIRKIDGQKALKKNDATFSPGFRLSGRDAAILAVGIIGAAVIGNRWWPASVILLVVVGNFFLFCNVFRVARVLELIWALFAVVLTVTTAATGFPGWTLTAVCCGLATALVIVYEMKKPSYHGWGWHLINPELRSWWDTRDQSQNQDQDQDQNTG